MTAELQSGADQRVLQLAGGYARLAGGSLTLLEPDLYQLTVPRGDERFFEGRSAVRIAFSVDALELDERAEMAIVGSGFVNDLINAVRARGGRLFGGAVVPPDLTSGSSPSLPARVVNASAAVAAIELGRHRVGRLTARVVIRAGTELRERLTDSGLYDLCSGLPLPADIGDACSSVMPSVATDARWSAIQPQPLLNMRSIVDRMLNDLETALRPEIEQVAEVAHRGMTQELDRINRYYAAMFDDMGGRGTDIPDADARRAIEAEHRRRSDEERDRHEVRAVVHPVQIREWEIVFQRASWELRSPAGHTGTFTAQRPLAGEQTWIAGCPTCGQTSPEGLVVCIRDHVSCDHCSAECSVCGHGHCRDHGIGACHVDGRAACADHSRKCKSCRKPHCSTHEGLCEDGAHSACSTCLAPCVNCRRQICDTHALTSDPEAPRGARRFCHACALVCEGGSSEVVGPDEVTRCASCDRVVCERHQSRCDVDGKVHCSRHLRRTDRSRRLICEQHRAACSHEPNSVFARDELTECATCGKVGCTAVHVLECIGDLQRHCVDHLQPVKDRPGALACADHRTNCHVDGVAFTLAGTRQCPCCGRRACREHMRECTNCRRSVCLSDYSASQKSCATCLKLEPTRDPSDAVMFAAIDLRGSEAGSPKGWKVARDARHVLAELDLGWTRRIVMAIPHGDQRAQTAVSHSALGSKVLRN